MLAASLVARGDTLLDDEPVILNSAIPGISDEAWTKFVRACATAQVSDVSPSNALGMFEMMPRRLADINYVEGLARKKGKSDRTVWVARFIAPMTSAKFLSSPDEQYIAFAKSMRDYAEKLVSGEISLPKDEEMSLSGALAVLHRGGPSGLKTWDCGERFSATVDAYKRCKDIF